VAQDGLAVSAVLASVIETHMLPALARDEGPRAHRTLWSAEEAAAVVRFLCESAPRICRRMYPVAQRPSAIRDGLDFEGI
jgi:hypothetical protein